MDCTTFHRLGRRTWSITRSAVVIVPVTIVIAVAGVVGTATTASAAVSGSVSGVRALAGPALAVADLPTVLDNATKWVVGILAALATFFFTLGGARYLAAGGDPSEVERAKSSLRSAGYGYALALLAPVILNVLKSILGV
jgi:hypothetical protein